MFAMYKKVDIRTYCTNGAHKYWQCTINRATVMLTNNETSKKAEKNMTI